MSRNIRKMYQERCWHLYHQARVWNQFAKDRANELTDARLAVGEYEREMNALLDEAEALLRATATTLADVGLGFHPVTRSIEEFLDPPALEP